MRKAKHTRPVSISLSPEVYDSIKKVTDQEEISMAEWFRVLAERALTVTNTTDRADDEKKPQRGKKTTFKPGSASHFDEGGLGQ